MALAAPAPSAPPPLPLSGPPPSAGSAAAPSLEIPPLPLKYGNKQAEKSTRDWDVAPSIVLVVMQSASPSPLSTLTPSPVVRALVPLEPLVSPVTLSQVEDILATSGMVQALHARFPPPASSSASSSSMEMNVDESPFPPHSFASSLDASFKPWTDTHPLPDPWEMPVMWGSWTDATLLHGVPAEGLRSFIKTVGASLPGVGQSKWARVRTLRVNSLATEINRQHLLGLTPLPPDYHLVVSGPPLV